MQLARLRLAGFKSFVEPAEIRIEPGLTGIVGPNGCGKSNLVDALRWVMGETSPKRMRGGEMDDVIFAGTQARPARSLAEAALLLDNTDRGAPAAFNGSDELEVVRRLERDSGSGYTVNGTEVRARDVQLLFADMVTGAHSSGLVSQGQISQLVEARPIERRAPLEEAAGIAGLHARRREAELRLRAAEANLERLADVAGTLEGQFRVLRRQARQAARYTRLSERIRAAEALLLLRLWRDAANEANVAATALRKAERTAAEAVEVAARASTDELTAAEELPALRHAEAEAGARLQRLAMERETLDADEHRAQEKLERNRTRVEQYALDEAREKALAEDAAARTATLEREAVALAAALDAQNQETQEARTALGHAVEEVSAAAAVADRLADNLTQSETMRARLAAEAESAERRSRELNDRRTETAAQLAELGAAGPVVEDAEDSVSEVVVARQTVTTYGQEHAAAERVREARQHALATAREALQDADAAFRQTAAELAALAQILSADSEQPRRPLLDAVMVKPGYEAALAAALGDDLLASAQSGAPTYWRTPSVAEGPALPSGATPLLAFVEGPAELRRRLSQIGVIDTGGGEEMGDRLAQGQRLVSRGGALWRWDGFTAAASSEPRSALRLRQRNRHAELASQAEDRKRAADRRRESFERARSDAAAADIAEATARALLRGAEDSLRAERETHAKALREAVANRERAASLRDAGAQLVGEIATAEDSVRRAKAALADIPQSDALRRQVSAARERLEKIRTAHAEADRAHLRLTNDTTEKTRRQAKTAAERKAWAARAAEAQSQLRRVGQRRATATAELAELLARPAETAARRDALLSAAQDAELQRTSAADALATAETAHAGLSAAARSCAEAAAAAREALVRATTQAENAEARHQEAAGRIGAELGADPDQARRIAGMSETDEPPPMADVGPRLEQMKREREQMGPVNLRAQTEADAAAEQLAAMAADREDLEGAIRRLRAGIGSLNREGRQRMLAAFEAADRHFRTLFSKLFDGGDARLELVDSDDPLNAGLEILASPPGKRLERLSLLSGGEQALTALALRLAVFLTNAAPVCVLDEVDAPLDDANVSRFCDLVADVSRQTATRFLIVTHHPLTMARMDRLFGVTMPERGVSQLVSVDLARAEALREAS